MQAPPIDKRGYTDLVEQTEDLAQRLSGWQPPPGGQVDAGRALIRIFGRFAELVVERLNRAPDKSFLAFLNLLGVAPVPPLPARVPLTFTLAEGSPVDATVPAGTLVAAPPLEGEEDEVVFETEESLVVTRAQLQAVVVSDTRADASAGRTGHALGAIDEPFDAFSADEPTPHDLYVACDPLLTREGPGRAVTLTLRSADTWQWRHWPVTWSSWDGEGWQPLDAAQTVTDDAWNVTLENVPRLTPHAVGGVEAGWLRARLELPLPPGETGRAPDRVAVGARNPQPAAFPLVPFPATGTSRFFYLSADGPFGAAGARARLRVDLARRGEATDLRLNWSYWEGDTWLPLGQSGSGDGQEHLGGDFALRDTTLALTSDGEVSFQVPAAWPRSVHRTRGGRWLRVDVDPDHGRYDTPPEIAALTAGHDWDLPHLGGITVTTRRVEAPVPRPPAGAYHNATPLDTSKDFYPFGSVPAFNDTFYVACPEALAQPDATVTLEVTLTNPAGVAGSPVTPVRADDDPTVRWEVADGHEWLQTQATYDFTTTGTVTLPSPGAPATVNGEEGYWLRARLVGGHYGTAATSTPNDDGTYEYSPATLAPPVVKSLSFTPDEPRQADEPASACLTYNDFVYSDHTAQAKGEAEAEAEEREFVPFSTTSDREPALYLGFDRPFNHRPVTLHLQVEPPRPEEVAADQLADVDPATAAQVVWEYAGVEGWRPLGAQDGTRGLSGRGQVRFVGPRDHAARTCFGQERYWLRARWWQGTFPLPPRLRRVLPNTTWAVQATTVSGEILGSSNGDPGQTFTTAQTPVLPGQQVVVREPDRPPAAEEEALAGLEGAGAVTGTGDGAGEPGEVWVRWHAVPDFYGSGPRDRHYTVDPRTGAVRFGDGAHGMLPPPGANNVRVTYRTGGGEQGNRAAGTVVELKSGVPYIDAVTNHEPAQGGARGEPVERVAERGPTVLRHRDRAVTAQDLEDLTTAASPEVARAAAVAPAFSPYNLWLDPQAPAPTTDHADADAGRMGVVVVPNAGAARPTPSLALLRTVLAHLKARAPATADVWVAGPEWVAVTVTTTVVVTSFEAAGTVGDRVRTALERFLHPLTGGTSGGGWEFGRKPHRSDLTAVIEAVEGVDHVRALDVELRPETGDPQREIDLEQLLNRPLAAGQPTELEERDLRRWLGRALVYSGGHVVEVAFVQDGP